MPSIEDNQRQWQQDYDWRQQGDEWSWRWGGPEAQWYGSILPRLHSLLPAGRILEIGPGFGRWTHFLRRHCGRLIGVDLAQRCVDHCRHRFADDPRLEFHVNDGRSLDMVEDGTIDLAFSMDSLVHADAAVLGDYLGQLARKLSPHGAGFVHHSNLGRYRAYFRLVDRVPPGLRMALYRAGLLDIDHWRGRDVTADGFVRQVTDAGLACVGQELINWGKNRRLIDCISVFLPAASARRRPLLRLENPRFMEEADRRLAHWPVYDLDRPTGQEPTP